MCGYESIQLGSEAKQQSIGGDVSLSFSCSFFWCWFCVCGARLLGDVPEPFDLRSVLKSAGCLVAKAMMVASRGI